MSGDSFPRSRYSATEFVQNFDSSKLSKDGNELCISFATSHELSDEIEIYFPSQTELPQPDLLLLARQVCVDITELDNMVQDSCEVEFQNSSLSVENYELFLA